MIVNGTSLARWTLDIHEPEAEREAEIPTALIATDQLLQLTFRVRDPNASAGQGARTRRLGVISVTLEPSEMP